MRPVSVPATKRVPSLQAGRPGPRTQGVKRRTSFYLPKGTVKHLHILSHTRASEVIDALLRKFTVVDNPRKFALFERSEKDDQGSAQNGPVPVAVAMSSWWQLPLGSGGPVVAIPLGGGVPHSGSIPVAVVSPECQHPPAVGSSLVAVAVGLSPMAAVSPMAAMSPMVMSP